MISLFEKVDLDLERLGQLREGQYPQPVPEEEPNDEGGEDGE